MTANGIEARNLRLTLGRREVLRDVSLSLAPGDFVALLGVNGAGKTSLLRLLLGLARPDAGEVLLDGKPLATLSRRTISRRMAYVPQAHVPSFPYTVREIVAMGRTSTVGLGRRLSSSDDDAVGSALQRLNIHRLAERNYAELSGGERQAVMIARALAQGARILVMDEPTAALDLGQQTRLIRLLIDLACEGYAIIASVHQPELVLRWFQRALLLDDGCVLADGPPRSVITTQNLFKTYGVDTRLVETVEGVSLHVAG